MAMRVWLATAVIMGALDFAATDSKISSLEVNVEGEDRLLNMHRNDDFTFFANFINKDFGTSDVDHLLRPLLSLHPGRQFVFRLPIVNQRTRQLHWFNMTVSEFDSLSIIGDNWCRQIGFDSVVDCVLEWSILIEDIPLLFVSGFVGADNNIGDISGHLIMRYFARKHGIVAMKLLPEMQTDGTPCVLFVGSLLNWAQDGSPCTVLGAGAIIDPRLMDRPFPVGLRLRAVRGPLSAAVADVTGQTEYMSDPGLLLPVVFPRQDFEELPCYDSTGERYVCEEKMHEVCFIIHVVDRDPFFGIYPEYRPLLVDNHQPMVTEFLQQLFQCRRVLSTSLHGIIFAHAYGIPAAVFRFGDAIIGGNFKYVDYYRSVGHHSFSGRPLIADIGAVFSLYEIASFIDSYWQPQPDVISGLQTKQMALINEYLKELRNQYAYVHPIDVKYPEQ